MVASGKDGVKGIVRESEIDMYTLLYLKWITNKVLLYSTGDPDQHHAAAWMGGEFGEEWVHVHACLGPFAVSQHCPLAVRQYKIILKRYIRVNQDKSWASALF